MSKPVIALVGRPNVGKSALFNRLVGQRRAIVEDVPGTTRDRLYGETEWNGVVFTVVDTGGFEIFAGPAPFRADGPSGPGEGPLRGLRGAAGLRDRPAPLATGSAGLVSEIRAQAQVAIAEADLIVLVVDVLDGLTAADEDVADVLRRSGRPVVVAANKADSEARRQAAVEFYALGLGEVYAISALHGTGVGDLLDAMVVNLPPTPEEEEPEALKIALVGRPNVGKSSLLNKLLGEERAIVSPVPGTTRDSIDTYLTWEGQPILLIDTAGIRRRGHIEPGIEKYSVLRAIKSVARADVVLLLLDAEDMVAAQDAHVAGYVLEENCSVILLVNKWDLVEKDTYTLDAYTKRIRAELKFLDFAPLLFISALTGQRVDKILPLAQQVYQERSKRIPTGELNRLVEDIKVRHTLPQRAGKQLKLYYATQAGIDPPTFVFFVNDTRLLHFSYERFIENQIRQHYGYLGTPLKLTFRSKPKE